MKYKRVLKEHSQRLFLMQLAYVSLEHQQSSHELSGCTFNLVGEMSSAESYYFYMQLLSPETDISAI